MKVTVKNVIGYEGLYIIDNLGNVISLPRQCGSRFVNQYNLMGTKVNKFGYKEVALSKDGNTKTFLLHRLIAIHFVKNPNNYSLVNHKNGIKTDNRIENLEWCSASQNTKHAYCNNLSGFMNLANSGIEKMNRNRQYVKVHLVAPDGCEMDFDSSAKAAEYLGTTRDEVTRAIRKEQRVKGHYAYGLKRLDCFD